jgi:DNA-directed RNA polymerase specialized sigma24 family protein
MIRASDTKQAEPDWRHIARFLARKALHTRPPLPASEVYSLAGLAVAMAIAKYRAHEATATLAAWTCGCGWFLLLNLLRTELRRRSRGPCVMSFTDLAGRRPPREQIELVEERIESALARDEPPQIVPDWLGRLTREERRVVFMRAAGWTLKEVAQAVGRSLAWVHHCLKNVRPRLADVAPQGARTR